MKNNKRYESLRRPLSVAVAGDARIRPNAASVYRPKLTYTPHVITQKRVDVEMSSQRHTRDEG